MKRKYGAFISPYDAKDYNIDVMGITVDPNKELFEAAQKYDIKIYDQGPTMKCAANAAMGLLRVLMYLAIGEYVDFSIDMFYGNRPDMYDGEGMYMKQAAMYLKKYGSVYANDFSSGATVAKCIEDVQARYNELIQMAFPYRGRVAIKLQNAQEIATVFEKYGLPVLMAFSVYDSIYQTGEDGIIPDASGTYLGGHAMLGLAVVKINDRWYLKCANSWGTDWGENGFCYLPIEQVKEAWAVLDQTPVAKMVTVDTIRVFTKNQYMQIFKSDGTNEEVKLITGLLEGRTVVELRGIAAAMGFKEIEWDNYNKIATFRKESQRI